MEKKKKTVLPFLIVIVIGLAMGLVCFFNFYFEKPEQAVQKAMDSVIRRDAETASTYLDYQQIGGNEENAALYDALLKDVHYTIDAVTKDGKEAEAKLTVSNRDMEEIYGKFVIDAYQLVISESSKSKEEQVGEEALKEKMDDMLLDAIKNQKTSDRVRTIDVKMHRQGRSWYLELTKDNLDAIYGGYLSSEEAAESILGDRSEASLEKLEKAYQSNIDDAGLVLKNAAHFVVDRIWNDTLRQIVSCINAGKDVNGEDYDIEKGMEELDKRMIQREQYDVYITHLEDQYQDAKDAWRQLTSDCDALVQELKEQQPEPLDYDYLPDTSQLEASMAAFIKIAYAEKE